MKGGVREMKGRRVFHPLKVRISPGGDAAEEE